MLWKSEKNSKKTLESEQTSVDTLQICIDPMAELLPYTGGLRKLVNKSEKVDHKLVNMGPDSVVDHTTSGGSPFAARGTFKEVELKIRVYTSGPKSPVCSLRNFLRFSAGRVSVDMIR